MIARTGWKWFCPIALVLAGCSGTSRESSEGVNAASPRAGTVQTDEPLIPARTVTTSAEFLPPDTPVVRYEFVIPATVGMDFAGNETAYPEFHFGDFLYEVQTGRCLYRFWYQVQDSHRFPAGTRFDELSDEDRARAVKSVAAYDGAAHWIAEFPPRIDNSAHARDVVVYETGTAPSWPEWRQPARQTMERRDWSLQSPIHELLRVLKCEHLNRSELLTALATSEIAHENPDGMWQILDPGEKGREDQWGRASSQVDLKTDESVIGLRRMTYQLRGAFFGHWPDTTPSKYSLDRDINYRGDTAEFEELLQYKAYCDEDTLVEVVSSRD